ncbi:MAG: hypothetical protein QOI66_3107, partial [Myxococcales bacterium]|nr:hypothetical protein [Myxococcales bacterium]
MAADPSPSPSPKSSLLRKPEQPRRVIIEGIRPSVDGGLVPIKRVLGDRVVVQVDLLADGHDKLAGRLLYRKTGADAWQKAPLRPSTTKPPPGGRRQDDRWWASFVVDQLGVWEYTVQGWVDAWSSWVWAVTRKIDAGQDVALELKTGATLLAAAAQRARDNPREVLRRLADRLAGPEASAPGAIAAALNEETAALMFAHPDDAAATTHQPPLSIIVDVPLARFGAWYEMFPRSRAGKSAAAADAPPQHGTFKTAEDRLTYI